MGSPQPETAAAGAAAAAAQLQQRLQILAKKLLCVHKAEEGVKSRMRPA